MTELLELREELHQDLMLCTTRDQHIRLTQRISKLDRILAALDTAK